MDRVFKKILTTCAVPGNELELRDYLIDKFDSLGKVTKTRWTDFYCGPKRESKKKPRAVVTAHMDSPGFIVRDINGDGTLDLIQLGGLNPKNMHLRPIRLVTSKKSHLGLLHRQGAPDGMTTDYQGYFGFKDEDEARKKGVEKGDSVCFEADVIKLANNLIVAPHIDNRVGCYIMYKVAQELKGEKTPHNVFYGATSCEEMGGRGARIMANTLKPNLAICLDATYEEGSVKMGQGPAVTLSDRSVLLSPRIRDQVKSIAEEEDIPVQFEVYNYAGTDAAGFKEAGEGCITICPLIPTLNNHSPHEIMHMEDVKNCIRLVTAIVRHGDSISCH